MSRLEQSIVSALVHMARYQDNRSLARAVAGEPVSYFGRPLSEPARVAYVNAIAGMVLS